MSRAVARGEPSGFATIPPVRRPSPSPATSQVHWRPRLGWTAAGAAPTAAAAGSVARIENILPIRAHLVRGQKHGAALSGEHISSRPRNTAPPYLAAAAAAGGG